MQPAAVRVVKPSHHRGEVVLVAVALAMLLNGCEPEPAVPTMPLFVLLALSLAEAVADMLSVDDARDTGAAVNGAAVVDSSRSHSAALENLALMASAKLVELVRAGDNEPPGDVEPDELEVLDGAVVTVEYEELAVGVGSVSRPEVTRLTLSGSSSGDRLAR